MSSSYKGHWLNGSHETGFTASAYDASDDEGNLRGADGKDLRLPMAAIKRAIDSAIVAKQLKFTLQDFVNYCKGKTGMQIYRTFEDGISQALRDEI